MAVIRMADGGTINIWGDSWLTAGDFTLTLKNREPQPVTRYVIRVNLAGRTCTAYTVPAESHKTVHLYAEEPERLFLCDTPLWLWPEEALAWPQNTD